MWYLTFISYLSLPILRHFCQVHCSINKSSSCYLLLDHFLTEFMEIYYFKCKWISLCNLFFFLMARSVTMAAGNERRRRNEGVLDVNKTSFSTNDLITQADNCRGNRKHPHNKKEIKTQHYLLSLKKHKDKLIVDYLKYSLAWRLNVHELHYCFLPH